MHAWPSPHTHPYRPTSDRSCLTSLQLTQTGLQNKRYKKSLLHSLLLSLFFFPNTPLLKKETTDTFTHLHLTFFPHPSPLSPPPTPLAIPQCSLQGGFWRHPVILLLQELLSPRLIFWLHGRPKCLRGVHVDARLFVCMQYVFSSMGAWERLWLRESGNQEAGEELPLWLYSEAEQQLGAQGGLPPQNHWRCMLTRPPAKCFPGACTTVVVMLCNNTVWGGK